MALVSMRAYARHRGVSLKAVQKAVHSGRIDKTGDGKIDVEQADADWSRNTGPRPSPTPEAVAANAKPNLPGYDAPPRQAPVPTGLDYSRARAVREGYLARLAKLDYQERTGKLVNRQEVEHAAAMLIYTERDALLSWPAQVCPIMASELGVDDRVLYGVLTDHIRALLTRLAKNPPLRLSSKSPFAEGVDAEG